MHLDFLILADKAEALNGKLYMIGGGFASVGMSQIPGPAQFDLAIGLVFDYHETGEQHELSVVLENADNRPVGNVIRLPLPIGRPPGLPPGDSVRLVIAIQGPFPIEAEGLHHFVVSVDENRFEPTRFRVHRLIPLVPQTPIGPAAGT